MSRKITIRDVAEKAGVSISSVHLALNGKRGVSEETRKEIKRVAEELGYHPNVIASTLKRKSGCIAILVPDVMDNNRYYYPPIWKGIRGYIDQDIAGLEFWNFLTMTPLRAKPRTSCLSCCMPMKSTDF